MMKKALDFLKKYEFYFVVLAIALVALVLRLAYIGLPFWYDEGCSHLVAKNSFPAGITEFLLTKDFQHMPLYFYVLHLWMQILGESDLSIRLLSLVFGLSTVPLAAVVGMKLHSKKAGYIAAVFLAVNVFLNVYSVEARMYSMVMFLALLSTNYLIDYDEKNKKSSLIKFCAANILICYTLTGAIAFVAAQVVCYLIYLIIRKKDAANFLVAQALSLFFLIPYFIILNIYLQARSEFVVSHVSDFMFTNFVEVIRNLLSASLGKIYWANYDPYFISFQFFLTVIVTLGYMLTGVFRSLKEDNRLIKLSFAVIVIVFLLNLIYAVQKIIVYTPRYVIYIAPLLLILAAIGISKLKRWNMIFFVVFYVLANVYGILTNQELFIMKNNSLYIPSQYIQKTLQMQRGDMVLMPFASSVAYRYISGENAPNIFVLEAIQELRNPNNENFYTPQQAKMFMENPNKTIQKIVLSDDIISPNFYNYIKQNVNDRVYPGSKLVIVLYGSDIDATIPPEQYKEIYSDIRNVENNTIKAMFAKFMNDLDIILREDFERIEIKHERNTSNCYIIYGKK